MKLKPLPAPTPQGRAEQIGAPWRSEGERGRQESRRRDEAGRYEAVQ